MTREDVQAWLDRYVEAWRTYEPETVSALFSADATYAYRPYEEPVRGREAIVADWLGDRDEAGSWEARYAPLVIDGDRAIATGETDYRDGRRFTNLFVMRFDDAGRCREFVEWFFERPATDRAPA